MTELATALDDHPDLMLIASSDRRVVVAENGELEWMSRQGDPESA
jgi:hypothetical protein